MPSGAMEPAGPQSKAFSEAFRGHVGRQRLSGKVLAANAGVSQNYLAKRLRDEVPFNFNDIESIAKALKLPLRQLLDEVEATIARTKQGVTVRSQDPVSPAV